MFNWSVFFTIVVMFLAFCTIEIFLEATGRGIFQGIYERLDRIDEKLDAIALHRE
jgi:hypothetical protein